VHNSSIESLSFLIVESRVNAAMAEVLNTYIISSAVGEERVEVSNMEINRILEVIGYITPLILFCE